MVPPTWLHRPILLAPGLTYMLLLLFFQDLHPSRVLSVLGMQQCKLLRYSVHLPSSLEALTPQFIPPASEVLDPRLEEKTFEQNGEVGWGLTLLVFYPISFTSALPPLCLLL